MVLSNRVIVTILGMGRAFIGYAKPAEEQPAIDDRFVEWKAEGQPVISGNFLRVDQTHRCAGWAGFRVRGASHQNKHDAQEANSGQRMKHSNLTKLLNDDEEIHLGSQDERLERDIWKDNNNFTFQVVKELLQLAEIAGHF